MSNAVELREALEHLEDGAYTNYSEAEVRAIVIDAARERLAQLEADPELVERMAKAIYEAQRNGPGQSHELAGPWPFGNAYGDRDKYLLMAGAALAAISTPTPVAKESL